MLSRFYCIYTGIAFSAANFVRNFSYLPLRQFFSSSFIISLSSFDNQPILLLTLLIFLTVVPFGLGCLEPLNYYH